jgi:hypothetical protein
MADSKPQFDAAGFFDAHGLTFKGLDKDTGHAIVESETGERGTYDIKGMLKSEGLDHENADITYNSPESPLNESPVGVLDRLKLSLGNTKGAVNYLKTKFDGATVDSSGALVVKDGGAWKKVDLDGISGDDGWKVSEVLGDVADLTGDLVVGAGSLLGATIGGTAGAAAGGIGAVPGAIAGSAAGAGVASGAKAALGRLIGTYDATPEEVVKDIALDTVLGGIGEGVAIGAKTMVGPAIKAGFSKITRAGEAFQDNAAKLLSAADGQNGPDIFRTAIANSDTVMPMVESYAKQAEKQATLRGAEAVASGLPQSQSVLMKEIAETAAADSARPLIENTQKGLTDFFGGNLDSLIEQHIPNAAEAARTLQQASTSIGNSLEQFFAKTGLGVQVAEDGARTYKALRPKEMQAFLSRMGSPVELNVAANMTRRLENLRSFTAGIKNSRDPANLKRVLGLSQELDSIIGDIPTGARKALEDSMQALGFDPIKSIDTALTSKGVLPQAFQEGYSALRGAYREKKAIVNSVIGSLQKRGSTETYQSIGEKMLDLHRAASRGDSQAAIALKTLADITPDGATHLNNFANRSAASAMASFRSAAALSPGGGVLQNATHVASKAALPASVMIGRMQRSATLKSFLNSSGYKLFAEGAKTLKSGGSRVLGNSELFGAGATTMFSALQQDGSQQ